MENKIISIKSQVLMGADSITLTEEEKEEQLNKDIDKFADGIDTNDFGIKISEDDFSKKLSHIYREDEVEQVPTVSRSKEEQAVYDQAEMLAFINDPEERKNATSLAIQVKNVVGNNWFTFNRFLVKTKETKETATFKIQLLKMFGMLQTKGGSWEDGKDARGNQVYKIAIDKLDRLSILDEIISFHQNEIEKIELQKQQIEREN